VRHRAPDLKKNAGLEAGCNWQLIKVRHRSNLASVSIRKSTLPTSPRRLAHEPAVPDTVSLLPQGKGMLLPVSKISG